MSTDPFADLTFCPADCFCEDCRTSLLPVNESWEEAYVPTFLPAEEVRRMEHSKTFPAGFRAPKEQRQKSNGYWAKPKPMSLARLDLFIMDWMDGNDATERYRKIKGTQEGQFYRIWDQAHELNWGKPFGEVKGVMDISRAGIYERFCRIMEKKPANGAPSALELFLDRFAKIYRINFNAFLSKQEMMMLLSYRLWASTDGIKSEAKVHDLLHAWASQSPGRRYREALGAQENSGIDGYLWLKASDGTTKKEVISIKTGKRAISPEFIYRERASKPHRRTPTLYVGLDSSGALLWLDLETVEQEGKPKRAASKVTRL